ncbi:type II secretion system protein GspD [Vibrio kanaloae]|uniref:type II secretion system protein GspD n=1 Tax=Vibrio kanaloae TaxID=170673 RepID=UPI003551BAF0
MSPNTRVRIQHDGSLSALLNDIERQLNVGFTPKGDTLNVERFVSRTFELELPPGMLSDQIGSGENSEGSSDEEASAKMDGQYVTLSSSDVDVFGEVALGVESLLQLDPDLTGEGDTQESLVGSVQAVPSLSRLVVRTTPGRMREVVEFVEQSKQSLTRQVALEVQVLEFRSNLGHDRGIDWNIVRDIGDNSLSFFIPGTSLVSGSSSPGFAFTGGGKWSGSTALINALNQQGQVSTETPITILVQNHQTNHITQERIIEFVENISSDSDEGVITTDTERGKRSEGVDFIVVPNIQRDHVYLRTSGMLTKIESLETQEVGGETLVFPQMREAKINFANKLKYGQTIVVASVSQIDTTTEESTFLGIPFLGGNSAVKQRVDTLVLLTPRRADG